MKRFLVFLVVATCFSAAKSQGRWEAYMARYEAGMGAVAVDEGLVRSAPLKELPFLVITGVTFKSCNGEGFPESKELKKLYKISERVNHAAYTSTKCVLVGTFTHQCQRLDYLYVKDTTNIRKELAAAYGKKDSEYEHHIRILNDSTWDAYTNFLYPNESVKDYMTNAKALDEMRTRGDALARPRFIEHLIYFENEPGRESFIQYIARIKFDVVSTPVIEGGKRPYQLRISKFEMVNLETLNAETALLRKKAREFGGEYDGWVTKVVK